MDSLLRPIPKMMPSFVISSNPLSLMPSRSSSRRPNPEFRLRNKKAISVIVQVPAEDGKILANLSKIPILGGNFVIEKAYPSSPSKQCNNCWRFRQVKPRCKNSTVCPLCAGPHTKADHLCPNLTCPKGGNLKLVLNCCTIASPAQCPNCSEDHSAGYRDCTARPVPSPRNAPSPSETEVAASATPRRTSQPAILQLPPSDPDAMDTQSDEARPPAPSSTPLPPGLESPLEFATLRAPLCSALMGALGSTIRIGRPQPNGELSPSPASRDPSASRR